MCNQKTFLRTFITEAAATARGHIARLFVQASHCDRTHCLFFNDIVQHFGGTAIWHMMRK